MIWVGFHPTFSRQSKANKFPLVFWLNENVPHKITIQQYKQETIPTKNMVSPLLVLFVL